MVNCCYTPPPINRDTGYIRTPLNQHHLILIKYFRSTWNQIFDSDYLNSYHDEFGTHGCSSYVDEQTSKHHSHIYQLYSDVLHISENRHCLEDYISSQTIRNFKPVEVIDNFDHHNEHKGDICVNRKIYQYNKSPNHYIYYMEENRKNSRYSQPSTQHLTYKQNHNRQQLTYMKLKQQRQPFILLHPDLLDISVIKQDRHCIEDDISSQTIKHVKPVTVLDKSDHHNEQKGDIYVNRKVYQYVEDERNTIKYSQVSTQKHQINKQNGYELLTSMKIPQQKYYLTLIVFAYAISCSIYMVLNYVNNQQQSTDNDEIAGSNSGGKDEYNPNGGNNSEDENRISGNEDTSSNDVTAGSRD